MASTNTVTNTDKYATNTKRRSYFMGWRATASNTQQIRSKYAANTQLRHVLAPSSLALGSQCQGALLLLVTGVWLTRHPLKSRQWRHSISTALHLLRCRLADREQLVAHVEALEHVVDGEHVRADAVALEGLARLAREAHRVALALRRRVHLLGVWGIQGLGRHPGGVRQAVAPRPRADFIICRQLDRE